MAECSLKSVTYIEIKSYFFCIYYRSDSKGFSSLIKIVALALRNISVNKYETYLQKIRNLSVNKC